MWLELMLGIDCLHAVLSIDCTRARDIVTSTDPFPFSSTNKPFHRQLLHKEAASRCSSSIQCLSSSAMWQSCPCHNQVPLTWGLLGQPLSALPWGVSSFEDKMDVGLLPCCVVMVIGCDGIDGDAPWVPFCSGSAVEFSSIQLWLACWWPEAQLVTAD